jgi:hypothetical protein
MSTSPERPALPPIIEVVTAAPVAYCRGPLTRALGR